MLPPSVRIFVASQPVDLRQSFDRLAACTQEQLGGDAFSGHLFVFRNRRGDRVKILYWDRSGFCLWYTRLEQRARLRGVGVGGVGSASGRH